MACLKELRRTGIIFTIFLTLFNSVTLFLKHSTIENYISHVVLFVVPAVVLLIVNNDWAYFIGLTFLAAATSFFGSYANLSAAIFILLAMKIKPQSEIFLYIAVAVVVIIKTLTQDFNVSNAFGLITGYAFIITTYKILHKTIPVKNIEGNEGNILCLLISGKNTKEIAIDLGTTQNAINQYIKRMRNKYNCESTYQLIYYLTKTGQIQHNSDIVSNEVNEKENIC